jgi:hypothetical protein
VKPRTGFKAFFETEFLASGNTGNHKHRRAPAKRKWIFFFKL